MARHPFGGGVADWVQLANESNVPVLQPGATLTFWNSREGGTQHLDLASDAAGETPLTAVVSSDGTDGYDVGAVPVFYGPPDVTSMWMSADGGNRVAVGSIDSADLAGSVSTQLAQHAGEPNPHGTSVATLMDTDVTAPVDGAVLAYDATAGKWEAASTTGLNPAAFVATAGGSTIAIATDDTTTRALGVTLPAGSRASAVSTARVQWNAGTTETPDWRTVFELDGYGQPRVQAAADDQVASRITRRSSGSTADLEQWCNESGTPLAWVTAQGLLRAPNSGRSVTFSKTGAISAGTGTFVWHNTTGVALLLRAYVFYLGTAGSTSSVFDVNLNGTTIFPSSKPTIAGSSNTTGIVTTSVTIPAGQRLSVDIDTAGTSAADLSVQLDLW